MMNILEFLIEDGVILDAVEFGNDAEFTLISRRKGQRKQQIKRLTLGQIKLVFAAMSEHGRMLQDAIDEIYERHRSDYDTLYRAKRLRIELKRLFGRAYDFSGTAEFPQAA